MLMGKSRIFEWLINILLVVSLTFSVVFIYWLVNPYDIIEPLEGNYELDKYVFEHGERLDIHLRICKKENIRETILGRFVDGVIFSIPSNESNFEAKCYDSYISSVSIPSTLPEGNYVYEEQVIYQVNPIRTISYTFRTPLFQVVDSDGL